MAVNFTNEEVDDDNDGEYHCIDDRPNEDKEELDPAEKEE